MISAGHDTQFALFGAGAGINEPVLSSGTWEILMARTSQVDTALLGQYPGATCELDSRTGLYNPGMQYLASGVLEWIRALFWSPGTDWDTILAQAAAIPNGADGVTMNTQLLDSPLAWLAGRYAHHNASPFLPRSPGRTHGASARKMPGAGGDRAI